MKNLLYIFMLGVTLQAVAGCKYFAVAESVSRLKVPTLAVSALLFNLECIMQSERTRDVYLDEARRQSECGLSDKHKRQSILYPLSHRTQCQIRLTTESLLTALYQHTKQPPQVDGFWTLKVRGPFNNALKADFPTIGQLLEEGNINAIREYPQYFFEDMHTIMHERVVE